jgi:hypothetical protein
MEVNPPDEDGFRGQFLQVSELLAFQSKTDDLGAMLQIDLLHQALAHYLPEHSEDQVVLLLDEGGGRNSRQLYSQTLSGI